MVPPLTKEVFLSNININIPIFSKKKNDEITISEKENLDIKVWNLSKFMNGILRKKNFKNFPYYIKNF